MWTINPAEAYLEDCEVVQNQTKFWFLDRGHKHNVDKYHLIVFPDPGARSGHH